MTSRGGRICCARSATNCEQRTLRPLNLAPRAEIEGVARGIEKIETVIEAAFAQARRLRGAELIWRLFAQPASL